ncbi:MAG TPA: tetratricopeptide repeat protein [Bordetella sp.]|nr:tetratricopeptide repeat protein [Bordetella sp.]
MDIHSTQGHTGALAYLERAAALAKGEKWAEMLTLADECQARYPFPAEWIRAQVHHRGGRLDVAIQCYERALAASAGTPGAESAEMRDSIARTWYGLARCFIESERVHLAIDPLQRATRLQPGVHDIWRDLGVARMMTGQATGDVAMIKAAHEPLKQACDLEPTNIGSWNALGGLYAMFNIQSGVKQVFDALMRIDAQAAMQFRDNVVALQSAEP